MKVCQYCGSENVDSAVKCVSCTGNSFSNKCNNCGSIFTGAFCSNCGTKAGAKPKTCPECGEEYFSKACPSCGYLPTRDTVSSQRSQTRAEESPVFQEEINAFRSFATQPPKKKIGLGTILLWIFFFPIMVFVAIWRSPRFGLITKIGLTILAIAFFGGFSR